MKEDFSILIPVYNFDVKPLVEQLLKLCSKKKSNSEIIVIDDCSSQFFKQKNANLAQLKTVNYIELTKNIGRSKIRNLLFEKAKFEYCIIMDCDVLLAKKSFLELYFEALNKKNVVVGGHLYLPKPPKDKSKYFHWLYGRKVEVVSLEKRLKNSYKSFKTNSFAISKSLFQSLKFEEKITEYGHEDTLFGIDLEKKQIPITHINNPVVHLGLENENLFLEKQEQAIANLVILSLKEEYKTVLNQKIKLIRFYNLFYNKMPYKFFIWMITNYVFFIEKFWKPDFIRLTKFNLWKLEIFDKYIKAR